jgi:aspartyl-tRNA(Asn)/glutamyl-tRNA(Gln) amidotransferase subunit B
VKDALYAEIKRQTAALNSGEKIVQETRLWNDAEGKTVLMRTKEDAHDYRYFPEPDLVPLVPSKELIARLAASLPELPHARKSRFVADFGLSAYDAGVLVADKALSDYFEAVVKAGNVPSKAAVNWVTTNIQGKLNAEKFGVEQCRIAPENLAGLIALIESGKISVKIGKDIFEKMWTIGKTASALVDEGGMTQVSDEGALRQWAQEAIAANPKAAEDVRGGNEKAISALVGFIMRQSKGKANPGLANRILKELL